VVIVEVGENELIMMSDWDDVVWADCVEVVFVVVLKFDDGFWLDLFRTLFLICNQVGGDALYWTPGSPAFVIAVDWVVWLSCRIRARRRDVEDGCVEISDIRWV